MIVSTSSHPVKCFKSVLDYIRRGSNQDFLWTHNLLRSGAKEVLNEFRDNAGYVRRRKGGVWFYHQWLSFHTKDRDKVTSLKAKVLLDKYLELLLGDRFFAVAAPHFDSKNIHVHLMFPANEIKGFRKIHLNTKEFREIRRELERFQQERFPELKHSIAYLKPRKRELDKPSKTSREIKRGNRLKKAGKPAISEKDAVFKTVKNCLETAVSEKEFKEKLEAASLELYRRGKTFGVKRLGGNGKYRKFRLNTLGLGKLFERTAVYWRNRPHMEAELNQARELSLRNGKRRCLVRELSDRGNDRD